MKPSQLRTRLARARKVTGLIQKEFADLTGLSLNAIKHYENGDNELFARHAAEIARKTGISAHWLLGVGNSEVPIGIDGKPYTARHFQLSQARSGKDKEKFNVLLENRAKAWTDYLIGKISNKFIPILLGDPSRAEILGCELDAAIRKVLNEIVELEDTHDGVDSVLRDHFKHRDDALALFSQSPAKRKRRSS